MNSKISSTTNEDLAQVRHIVMSGIGKRARVYLYGSHARGMATRTSDIDVGVVAETPMDPALLSDIREALEQSNILCPVDLVDLTQTDATFRKHALQDAIQWTV